MIKKYFDMTKTEKELIIKLFICTVLATAFSWLMNDPYSVTTVVTANLFLYTDRGYKGSILYAKRRTLVQAIQGIFVLAIIIPCKYFQVPIPDSLLIIISCCAALCIGLPLNYKNSYAPLNCTLANATFIVACASIQSLEFLPKRVLQCIAGALIGYFVNFVIFSYKDRVSEIQHLIQESVTGLICHLDFKTYQKNLKAIDQEMAFLLEDNGSTKKIRISQEMIQRLQMQRTLLETLGNFLIVYEKNKGNVSTEFHNALQATFCRTSEVHLCLMENNHKALLQEKGMELPSAIVLSPLEICVAGRFVEYTDAINQMITLSCAA